MTPAPDAGEPGAALPALVVVTDRHQAGERGVPAVVAAAVAGGARWVLLRDRDLPAGERDELRARLAGILAEVGGLLSVAGARRDGEARGTSPDAGPPATRGRDARHLGAAEPLPASRPPVLGRSCHSAAELGRAEEEGCDYAFISPVLGSPSKPGYGPPIGLGTLAEWCTAVTLPVYALGGVTPAAAGPCRRAGAAGVAVMGAVMRAEHPDRVVGELVAELAP